MDIKTNKQYSSRQHYIKLRDKQRMCFKKKALSLINFKVQCAFWHPINLSLREMSRLLSLTSQSLPPNSLMGSGNDGSWQGSNIPLVESCVIWNAKKNISTHFYSQSVVSLVDTSSGACRQAGRQALAVPLLKTLAPLSARSDNNWSTIQWSAGVNKLWSTGD